jgi:hypothetical protein
VRLILLQGTALTLMYAMKWSSRGVGEVGDRGGDIEAGDQVQHKAIAELRDVFVTILTGITTTKMALNNQ